MRRKSRSSGISEGKKKVGTPPPTLSQKQKTFDTLRLKPLIYYESIPMNYTVKSLPKGIVEFTFTVEPSDIQPQLEKAAAELSSARPIPGFRPGKASFDLVKTRFGEMALYEQALGEIVRSNINEALQKEKVMIFGQPQISVKTLAPGNPITFTAEVVKIPKATTVPNIEDISVTEKTIETKDTDVDSALKELTRMQSREEKADRPAEANDKIVVDMDLSQDNVALEGGQARNHGIFLNEDYYIPGVKEQLLGKKAGEELTFTLPFPEDHYQKNLAGKNIDFKVTVKDVMHIITPAIDDTFAKSLGQDSLEKLRTLLKDNITHENQERENERQEIEMIQNIISKSTFEEIPEVIINAEADRMVHELQHDIEARGIPFEKYLESIQKTANQIKLDMAAKAVERIQAAVIMNALAEQLSIEISDEEVLDEVQKLMNQNRDPQAQERFRSEAFHDHLRVTMRNRRIISTLKEKVKKTK
jgi:trigger factor